MQLNASSSKLRSMLNFVRDCKSGFEIIPAGHHELQILNELAEANPTVLEKVGTTFVRFTRL